ncbi:M23 family peptidase, partial [Bacteroides fragilis]|nr:M23 family peptidase [Bacteroides fragilis]
SVIGNEGQSTGPHLHFEVHPDGGAAVDPVNWFAQRGINI